MLDCKIDEVKDEEDLYFRNTSLRLFRILLIIESSNFFIFNCYNKIN